MQVDISLAGWLSKASLNSLTAVHCTTEYVILALFDWHGTPNAAQFAASCVIKVAFEAATRTHNQKRMKKDIPYLLFLISLSLRCRWHHELRYTVCLRSPGSPVLHLISIRTAQSQRMPVIKMFTSLILLLERLHGNPGCRSS